MSTAFMVATTVAGPALQIEGNRRKAKAQEEAMRIEAAEKRLQADELIRRFEINTKQKLKEGKFVKAEQTAQFALSDIELSGSSLLALEETQRAMTESIDLERQELEFKVQALRRGASFDDIQAGKIREAEKFDRFAILYSHASRGAQMAASGGG